MYWARVDFDSGQNTPAPLSVTAAGRTRGGKGDRVFKYSEKSENVKLDVCLTNKSAEHCKMHKKWNMAPKFVKQILLALYAHALHVKIISDHEICAGISLVNVMCVKPH